MISKPNISFSKMIRIVGVLALLPVISFSEFEPIAKASEKQQSVQSSEHPLSITDVSVSPTPVVGQTVTLTVTVESIYDEQGVKFAVDTLESAGNKINLIAGDPVWQGALIANQPNTFAFSIVVTEEGDWPIRIQVVSYASHEIVRSDFEIVHLIVTVDSVKLIRSSEYTFSQIIKPGHIPQFLLPPNTMSSQIDTLALTAGQVQVEGDLTYQAEMTDDFDTDVIRDPAGNPLDMPLGRVIVKLYDRRPIGDVLVSETRADDAGHYVSDIFPYSASNDIYMEIYATDDDGTANNGARVNVVDSSGNTYRTDLIHVGNLPDGVTTPFDYTIPINQITLARSSQPFYIFDQTANIAYNWVEARTGWGAQRAVKINWPLKCVPVWPDSWQGDGCFRGPIEIGGNLIIYRGNGSDGEIYLKQDPGLEPDLFLHEYGHFVLSRSLGEQTVIEACNPPSHSISDELSVSCAWSEGWADFFAMAVENSIAVDPNPDNRNWDLENLEDELIGGPIPPAQFHVTGNPEKYEGIVAATLWDIFDGANEPHD